MKAQYGILRFKKYKGPAISPIEAHNERTKEQYASNPDIDTSRSRYNLHLVQPQGRYREEADRMIAAAHCRVRKDSVRVVEALVTASPEFFKDKTNREIRAYLSLIHICSCTGSGCGGCALAILQTGQDHSQNCGEVGSYTHLDVYKRQSMQ